MEEQNNLIETLEDGVLTLTLNRPDRLNALDEDLSHKLAETLQRVSEDPAARLVVLRGSGRAFCVGGDIKAASKKKPSTGEQKPRPPLSLEERIERRLQKKNAHMQSARLLHEMPKPTIAVIQGHVVGAGLSLAMACDFRLAQQDLKMRPGFVDNALSGDYGIGYFLTHMVGIAKARELLMLSPRIDAQQALNDGLVTRVFEEPEFNQRVNEFVENLVGGPTLAFKGVKENLRDALHMELGEFITAEARRNVTLGFTEDCREAGRAFREKRKPDFQGK